MTTSVTREELLVAARRADPRAARRPAREPWPSTACPASGRPRWPTEVADRGDRRRHGPSSRSSYDDFHQPRERAAPAGPAVGRGLPRRLLRPGRAAPAGAGPAGRRRRPIVPGSFDLAADEPRCRPRCRCRGGRGGAGRGRVPAGAGRPRGRVGPRRCCSSPTRPRCSTRALARDARPRDAGAGAQLYLRRYLAAWSLHEERDDPWSRADLVVDLSDPTAPAAAAADVARPGRAAAARPHSMRVGHVDVNGVSYYLPDGRLPAGRRRRSGSATAPRSRWSAPTAPARRRCCGWSPATSTRTSGVDRRGPAGSA